MLPSQYNKTISLKLESNGYLYFLDKDHPLAYQSNNRVYYHRHIASIKIDRWIEEDEHVHHLDGNKQNNNPINLILVDPSTHTKLHNPIRPQVCKGCLNIFYPKNKRVSKSFCCEKCKESYFTNRGYIRQGAAFSEPRKKKINWPEPETMKRLVWEKPTTHLAKELGVSDKAIDKFCRKHNIDKPPRGYWGNNQFN